MMTCAISATMSKTLPSFRNGAITLIMAKSCQYWLLPRVVGNASLHFYEGPKRHVGEVRLFLAKDYRKRGLGMKMIRALIGQARKHGLSILMAEMIADMTKFVKAFEQLGFKSMCTLDDYFMFPDGDSSDVVLMMMSLRSKTDEF
jgi:L-amino acid N-acyltransferase YncA